MDLELILKQSLEINIKYHREKDEPIYNSDIFKKQMESEYSALFKEYSAIFTISLGPSYNFNRLKKMLLLANKIKTKEISEHSASVEVGQILVNEIVKPQLNKK